jgi:hypothetical protein
VVEQPDRKETEDEGMSRAPEPEILMQDIKHPDDDHQQGSLHPIFACSRRQNVCVLWHIA